MKEASSLFLGPAGLTYTHSIGEEDRILSSEFRNVGTDTRPQQQQSPRVPLLSDTITVAHSAPLTSTPTKNTHGVIDRGG